ncbi:MAG: cyclopropane-fatty-acyl-phospholipid synthase family protein [Beijerinckiaceae bacterium]|nr:cyclopropane-fatty-acyl-phospholipid synthase family protein [Beijerinckiaceae bacterium]
MDTLLKFVFRQLVTTGSLELVTANGRHHQFGDGTGRAVRIRFVDRAAEIAFLLDPDLKFGELYVDSRILVEEGTVFDFLSLVLRERKVSILPAVTALVMRYRFITRRFLQNNGVIRARSNVAHHYDLDDRLYDLFLDKDRQYSCAYFEHDDATLEEAQLAKKRHIAAKLLLEPGNRVLDIGCGWGGMALYLHRVAQAGEVTGITLSQEQLAVAKRRAEEAGVADTIRFQLQDYRELDAKFERIVSVGMFEHVGLNYYDAFFRKVADLLTDDGVMLLHTIGSSDVPSFTNPWIVKYIFPGGHIPSLSDIAASAERAKLIITDVEVLRLHYAKTLRHWRNRFLARRDEAVKLYDDRFCRMWEMYLSMSETAFLYEDAVVFQLQIAKRQENAPLTRDYIGKAEDALREAEQSVVLT